MRTTRDTDFFGKRPNWVLKHPVMHGSPYHQAVYTHLRGMNPKAVWKSERELTKTVSDETGFGESTCRKVWITLRREGFVGLDGHQKLVFGTEEVVLYRTTSGSVGNQSGSVENQNGSVQNHFTPSDLRGCDTRSVDQVESSKELEGTGTNVPVPYPAGYEVHLPSETGETMILGADSEAPQPEANRKIPNQPLMVLDHFNFVARKMRANPITEQRDRISFLAHTKRYLSSGLTVPALKDMIDRFFQFDRNREHIAPWKLFVTKEIHQSLTVNAKEILVEDDVLQWISRDFSRTSPLPWDEDFDGYFQTLVQRSGMSVAYRYPDIIAQIAKLSSGDRTLAQTLVSSSASLIDKYLNDDLHDTTDILQILTSHGIQIPTDLTPKRIRRESQTLQEAVITASRRGK